MEQWHVIIGWSGAFREDVDDVKYNPENCFYCNIPYKTNNM